jgi:hypothetical protein
MWGAALLACLLSGCGARPSSETTQTQSQPASQTGMISTVNLSTMAGKVCSISYQSGSSSSGTTGTLKEVGTDWVVLDVLEFQRNNLITDASGEKRYVAIYAKTKNQRWIAAKSITTVSFDEDIEVR